MDIASMMDIIAEMKEAVPEDQLELIEEDYRAEDGGMGLSESMHRQLTVSAIRLWERAKEVGMDDRDKKILAIYGLVCANCMKRHLDVLKFEDDVGIPSMRLRYIFRVK